MPHMNPWSPLNVGPVFKRLFGHFMKIFASRFHLLGSADQQPVFRRINIVSFLKKILLSLLFLPGWHQDRKQRDVEDTKQSPTNEFVPDSALVIKRKTRKRALLIGIKEIVEAIPEVAMEPVVKPSVRSSSLPIKAKEAKSKAPDNSRMKGVVKSAHEDVKAIQELLEEVYEYAPADITILIDAPDQIQPTKENIVFQIGKLIENATEDDRFFFHFSGHSGQEPTDDDEEEDGMDEFILTSDGRKIMDNELRRKLVNPLPSTCSLIAVFDSCHSCTLLDLPHFRCNHVYVPWISKGHRRTKSLWERNHRHQAKPFTRSGMRSNSSPLNVLAGISENSLGAVAEQIQGVDPQNNDPTTALLASKQGKALSVLTNVKAAHVLDSPTSTARQFSSPIAKYCEGDCRKNMSGRKEREPKADVICLSSAEDSQLSWEDTNGNSMTQFLVKILREKSDRTLRDVLTLKELNAHNQKLISKGKDPVPAVPCEMHNFQDPQLSSHYPLNMDRIFKP